MSSKGTLWGWGILGCAAVTACVGSILTNTLAQPEDGAAKAVKVETILPADPILYLSWDGEAAHAESFKKTAMYQAFYETGLVDVFTKFFTQGGAQLNRQQYEDILKVFKKIQQNGFTVAGWGTPSPQMPMPHGMFVFHDAASIEPTLAKHIKAGAGPANVQLQTKTIHDRKVTFTIVPDSPGVELGWWTEGNHLVVGMGIQATEQAVNIAAGKSPNLTTNKLWKKHQQGKQGFEQTAVAWLSIEAIRALVGDMPVPNGPNGQLRLNDIVKALGLDGLQAFVMKSGYKGKSQWSETIIEAPGERKGLLALGEQKPITLKDLPPIPHNSPGFGGFSLDWSAMYDSLKKTALDVAELGPPNAAAQVEGMLKNLPRMVGFDPKEAFFDSLGNITCVYADDNQAPFGMGFGVAMQTKDADRLRATASLLLTRLEGIAPREQVKIRRTKKHGVEIVTAEIGFGMFNPSFVIDDDWMVFGLLPQVPEAYVLRKQNKLPTWEPNEEVKQALSELPQEYTSIAINNPKRTYQALMSWAPFMLGSMKAGLQQQIEQGLPINIEIPVSVADLPPAELVVKPLFHNVAVNIVDKDGYRTIARSSVPSVPFVGDAQSVAAIPVLTALLLPAVQQARMAARRAQSSNNLKQIGLALHNYHETYSHFPSGTVPNEDIKKVEERISWMASILPFMDNRALSDSIDFKKKFNDEDNQRWMSTYIPSYLDPNNPNEWTEKKLEGPSYGRTHYVGIAGVGADAPTLPAGHKRAGIFGYNRKVNIRNITDGTSNTMMVSESRDGGNWGQGGKSTIRAFTKKPYFNGPDGIGSYLPNGTQVLFADGSVRTISPNIDPSVVEAMSTANGGEIINE